MTHITLIRHGQANTHATTAEDYDRLSELGQQQAAWLGQYLHETQAQFDHVWAGDMSRHLATARGRMGSSMEYLENTVAHLDALGIGDGPMHDILKRARAYDGPVPQGRWEKGRWQARR